MASTLNVFCKIFNSSWGDCSRQVGARSCRSVNNWHIDMQFHGDKTEIVSACLDMTTCKSFKRNRWNAAEIIKCTSGLKKTNQKSLEICKTIFSTNLPQWCKSCFRTPSVVQFKASTLWHCLVTTSQSFCESLTVFLKLWRIFWIIIPY